MRRCVAFCWAAAAATALAAAPAATAAEDPPPAPGTSARAPARAPARANATRARPRRLRRQPGRRLAEDLRHSTATLLHDVPIGAAVQEFFVQLTPLKTTESTYFGTISHYEGYAGLQQNADHWLFFPWFEGQAIFSIWDNGCRDLQDPDDCPASQRGRVAECGQDVLCSRFGNEGVGWKSELYFDDWEVNRDYSSLIRVVDVGGGKVRYEGYFHAEELGGWVLLGKFEVTPEQAGAYLHNFDSFLEQYDHMSFSTPRNGLYGRAFYRLQGASDWRQVTRGSFRHFVAPGEDASLTKAYLDGSGRRWGLALGDGPMVSTATLNVAPDPALPQALADFDNLAAAGALPRGCAGGTCAPVLMWFKKMFRSDVLGFSLLILLALVCFFMLLWWYCLQIFRRVRKVPAPPPSGQGLPGGGAAVAGIDGGLQGARRGRPVAAVASVAPSAAALRGAGGLARGATREPRELGAAAQGARGGGAATAAAALAGGDGAAPAAAVPAGGACRSVWNSLFLL